MSRNVRRRFLASFVPLALAAWAGSASAIEFNVLGNSMKFENLVTAGALMRMQAQDPSLIGKSSLNPGICVRKDRTPGDPTPLIGGADLYDGDTCTTSTLAANERFVAAPGSFSPNGDDGNMSFDKYDIAMATAKWTLDFSWSLFDYNLFMRGIAFYDQAYRTFVVHHRDTTFQGRESGLGGAASTQVAWDYDLLDYNLSHVFSIPGVGRDLSVKIGSQVLNWGESSFLLSNSMNAINPPDQTRLRVPGFDLKELLQPVGMIVLGTDIIENLSIQGYYQYEWKPVIVDPPGTFYSQSDTLGAGGTMSMLSFAKAPEDPDCLSRPIDNSDSPVNPNDDPAGEGDPLWTLGSTGCRTIYRDSDLEKSRRPDKYELGKQGGFKLTYFAENFNNGTEFAFYFANYTSRFPVVSAISAEATCLDSDLGIVSLIASCGFLAPGNADAQEPLPVNTARLVVEYPENIQLYGLSFNTTVGDYALSGEYAFRPNLPTQLHTTDLAFAALQPAFPEADMGVPGAVFGLPIGASVSVLPGRRSAVPDFITQYRNPGCGADCIGPNQYIRGYERMKTGQLNLTALKLIGGDNPLGASQITLLLETGLNHVIDMPGLDELQFNGAGTDTHISHGADGTAGIEPSDIRNNPDGQHEVPDVDGADCASPTNPVVTTSEVNPRCLRQNPTAHRDYSGFGTEYSWGYRFVMLPRWDDAFLGVNLEFLAGFFHDVEGTTPGIGGNFVEGRKNILGGLRFDYLSSWIGEVRYTWFTGGKNRDQLRDRDNVTVFVGYLF